MTTHGKVEIHLTSSDSEDTEFEARNTGKDELSQERFRGTHFGVSEHVHRR